LKNISVLKNVLKIAKTTPNRFGEYALPDLKNRLRCAVIASAISGPWTTRYLLGAATALGIEQVEMFGGFIGFI
jgi:hypothetical protein